MNIVIRADASIRIGTGHLMRCLALAQSRQEMGGAVHFVCAGIVPALEIRLQKEGMRLTCVECVAGDENDMTRTVTLARETKADWVILDGYHFTPEYQKAICEAGVHLLIIDDMNHLLHYHADILLNQNIHALELEYKCDKDTNLLLGNQYVLLRKEFLKYRCFKRNIPESAKNILVTMGGADTDNITLKITEALNLICHPEMDVKIVIGYTNPHQKIIKQALQSSCFVSHIMKNSNNMPNLMAWADVAISAGGSTCWELAFMELPSILMALSPDQQGIVDGLSQSGFALKVDEHDAQDIANALNALIVDHEKRKTMSIQGRKLVDGYGSCRVVNAMEAIK